MEIDNKKITRQTHAVDMGWKSTEAMDSELANTDDLPRFCSHNLNNQPSLWTYLSTYLANTRHGHRTQDNE